jgi:glyoxylase-like metal-dependent hydrolase (beta-lactamase superfamily II)
MTNRFVVLLGILVLPAGLALGQDARGILQAAARTMGADDMETIQISGTGWIANVGQAYSVGEDWPRYEVTDYTRIIDYDAGYSREDLTRQRGSYPDRGGGRPFQGEQLITEILNGDYAWNIVGDRPVPQTRFYLDGVPVADFRKLDILLTPHGFLKAALESDAEALSLTIAGASNGGLTQDGGQVTIVSFLAHGKYRVNGTINEQNLVELVTTWYPNPVYGDMLFEMRYTQYQDFGGVMFPTVMHEHQGDPVLNPAHNSMEIRVTDVQVNNSVTEMAVPRAIQQAAVPPVNVESERLAVGVWRLAGSSHHSIVVEFNDFVAVIEAPQNEARSLAVIEETGRLVPGKPIRYIVNTHHHFDHSGGLRTYLSQGATVVTHQGNRDYYQDVMFHPAPRTLSPDRLDKFYPMFTVSRRPAPIEAVNQKYVVSDGDRTLEIHPVQGLGHAQNMVMVYLPGERILVNADLYTPPAPGAQAAPTPNMLSLYRNMQRLKLDVVQHVPLHGGVGTNEQFLRLMDEAS